MRVLSGIAAGTPEAGGWTSREVKRIIRGLAGLNFVFVSHTMSASVRDFTQRFFPVARMLSKSHLRTTTVGRTSFHLGNF